MSLWAKFKGWIQSWFEGAQYSIERSYIPAQVQSPTKDIPAGTRMELLRKSRYFEQNNAIFNRCADLFECYTVGCGHEITPSSSDPEWNERAKKWWSGWEDNADMTTRQSFGTLMGLLARTGFVDGGCFVKLGYGESGRPRIQLVEGHMVKTPPDKAESEGISIIDGVRVDGKGRPVGYYIGQETGKGQVDYQPFSTRVVLHYFEPSRPGQYRELPMVYPVINVLHDLDDLHRLTMQKAKDAAEITNVIKNDAGEVDSRNKTRQRLTRSVTLSDGSTTATESSSSYYQSTVGGRTVVLRKGDELEQFRSDQPGVVTMEYWKLLTEQFCAGVGIPYCLVFPSSMQGTVYRGALDMANSWFRARFEVIAEVERRIYQFVMNWARFNVRELADAPADWANVSIHPPRAVNVDVGRNSSAMLAELKQGATNYELIYGPLGKDWREQFRKLKEQHDYAKEIGLPLPGAMTETKADTEPQPTPEPAKTVTK